MPSRIAIFPIAVRVFDEDFRDRAGFTAGAPFGERARDLRGVWANRAGILLVDRKLFRSRHEDPPMSSISRRSHGVEPYSASNPTEPNSSPRSTARRTISRASSGLSGSRSLSGIFACRHLSDFAPAFGQIETSIDQGAAFPVAQRGKHAHLAVLHLAQPSVPLPRHPGRLVALLREAALVDQQCRVRSAEQLACVARHPIQQRRWSHGESERNCCSNWYSYSSTYPPCAPCSCAAPSSEARPGSASPCPPRCGGRIKISDSHWQIP